MGVDDPIKKAIAATEKAPPPPRFHATMRFENDRIGVLDVPADLTRDEIIGMVAFVAGEAAATIMRVQAEAQETAATSQVLVPVRPKILVPH